jgi:hypothetical protein
MACRCRRSDPEAECRSPDRLILLTAPATQAFGFYLSFFEMSVFNLRLSELFSNRKSPAAP